MRIRVGVRWKGIGERWKGRVGRWVDDGGWRVLGGRG